MKSVILLFLIVLFGKISLASSVTVDEGPNRNEATCFNGWGTPYKCSREEALENSKEKILDSINNESVSNTFKILKF